MQGKDACYQHLSRSPDYLWESARAEAESAETRQAGEYCTGSEGQFFKR
jgi:hypothetical protein